jgi:cytochrome c oxidase assembly factor CtaG
MAMIPPLEWSSALRTWSFDGLLAGVSVIAVVGYVVGMRRLAARGRKWPASRAVAYMGGVAILVLATQSVIGAYDTTLFSIHVLQHLMLSMAGPLLLVLGRPVTLAVQASQRTVQLGIIEVLGSRPMRFVSRPLVVWTSFASVMFAYYFTAWYDLTLTNELVHELTHLVFVVVGTLFFWVVLGIDSTRVRSGYPARVLALLVAMPFHVFLGVAILSSRTILGDQHYSALNRSWGPTLLSDQQAGGAIMWIGGSLIALAALLATGWQWRLADLREARRYDRLAGPGSTARLERDRRAN